MVKPSPPSYRVSSAGIGGWKRQSQFSPDAVIQSFLHSFTHSLVLGANATESMRSELGWDGEEGRWDLCELAGSGRSSDGATEDGVGEGEGEWENGGKQASRASPGQVKVFDGMDGWMGGWMDSQTFIQCLI